MKFLSILNRISRKLHSKLGRFLSIKAPRCKGCKWCHPLPKGYCTGLRWRQLNEGIGNAHCAMGWQPWAGA